jgi:two-component system, OmpR family, phosphate regulon response regulator PhoB
MAPIEVPDLRLDPASHRLEAGAEWLYLSRIQTQILALLMSRVGEVVVYHRLIHAAWDHRVFMPANPQRTVAVHVSTIRRLLRLIGSRYRIVAMIEAGYMLVAPPPAASSIGQGAQGSRERS